MMVVGRKSSKIFTGFPLTEARPEAVAPDPRGKAGISAPILKSPVVSGPSVLFGHTQSVKGGKGAPPEENQSLGRQSLNSEEFEELNEAILLVPKTFCGVLSDMFHRFAQFLDLFVNQANEVEGAILLELLDLLRLFDQSCVEIGASPETHIRGCRLLAASIFRRFRWYRKEPNTAKPWLKQKEKSAPIKVIPGWHDRVKRTNFHEKHNRKHLFGEPPTDDEDDPLDDVDWKRLQSGGKRGYYFWDCQSVRQPMWKSELFSSGVKFGAEPNVNDTQNKIEGSENESLSNSQGDSERRDGSSKKPQRNMLASFQPRRSPKVNINSSMTGRNMRGGTKGGRGDTSEPSPRGKKGKAKGKGLNEEAMEMKGNVFRGWKKVIREGIEARRVKREVERKEKEAKAKKAKEDAKKKKREEEKKREQRRKKKRQAETSSSSDSSSDNSSSSTSDSSSSSSDSSNSGDSSSSSDDSRSKSKSKSNQKGKDKSDSDKGATSDSIPPEERGYHFCLNTIYIDYTKAIGLKLIPDKKAGKSGPEWEPMFTQYRLPLRGQAKFPEISRTTILPSSWKSQKIKVVVVNKMGDELGDFEITKLSSAALKSAVPKSKIDEEDLTVKKTDNNVSSRIKVEYAIYAVGDAK